MAVLTVTPITRAGIAGTLAAAASGGDSFPNSGKEFVEVANGSGSSVTVNVAGVIDGQTVAALRAIAVPAGARRLIGPFPQSPYNDSNGRVALTYSAVTSVTVGVFSAS